MAQVNLGHVVGPGVPSGGTAGQVLKKNGSTNYDTSWATLNSGNIPVSASDNTTVQQSLAAVKSDMGIVEDGNTATHTISAGQYVIWKGALYTASAAIPAGTTLSTSNLTAVSGGGLNALNGKIENKIFTNIYSDYIEGNTPKTYTLPSNATAALVIGNNGNGNTGVHAVSMRNNTEIAATQITSQSPFATFSTSGMTFTVQANYVTRVKVIMF